jgi:3-dehydroquinate dehydratase-2
MLVYVLSGPNLNMLGRREPGVYGTTTLAEIEAGLREAGAARGITVECRQSNHEGELIDWIHEAFERGADGVMINPGGYTHTSVALRDAMAMLGCPKVELHLSNVWAREEFRHHSFISPVVDAVIGGLGPDSYAVAFEGLTRLMAKRRAALSAQNGDLA